MKISVFVSVVYLKGGGADQHAQQAHFIHGARAFAFAFALIFALLIVSPKLIHTHTNITNTITRKLHAAHTDGHSLHLALLATLSLSLCVSAYSWRSWQCSCQRQRCRLTFSL